MREAFIEKLKELSPDFDFTETLLDNDRLFVYDVTREDESGRRQSFTEMLDAPTGDRCFQIENPKLENIVAHVCIDGDLIPYGQENYDSANTEFSQGRPDFMIFDNDTFLVVEMKTEQEDLSFDKEKTLWKTFFKGIGQIIDFVKFLRRNGIEIKTYYPQAKAIVCMRFLPQSAANAQRNTELVKRTMQLGFPITQHNHQNFYTI